MLRVDGNQETMGFTEFEEEILFDTDDPDFVDKVSTIPLPIVIKVTSNMSSTGSIHPGELHSSRSSPSPNRSVEDVQSLGCSLNSQFESSHVLTIEELRLQMSGCFTCGVSWVEQHVSLDCPECGGYAMERPCPSCSGCCRAIWKRDLPMSHSSGTACWQGRCSMKKLYKQQLQPKERAASSKDLCTKLEMLGATS